MPSFRNGLCRIGKVYHYCFRINGKQYKGSTRATERAIAEQVLALKRKEALLGPQPPEIPMPKLEELVSSWLETYASTYSKRHIDLVDNCAKVWLLPAFGEHYVDRITTQAVLNLRSKMLDAGRSPATANLMLRNLKLLMSYAIRLGHLTELPFKVSPLRLQRKPRPTIPAQQVGDFFAIVDQITTNTQVRTMFRMMVGLGLRVSEALNARWEWVDPERRTYTVGKAKGKEARILPVPDWLWSSLTRPSGRLSGWMFPSESGTPHGRMFLVRYLKQASAKLELPSLTQHRLRATFATLHAEAGTPIPEIQGMLGHKNIATTMIYIETSLESKRRSQDALSQRLGLA
jgi:integrase